MGMVGMNGAVKPLSASHKRDLEWIQGFSDPEFLDASLSKASRSALLEHGFIAPIEGKDGWFRVLSPRERAIAQYMVAKEHALAAYKALENAWDIAAADGARVMVMDDIAGDRDSAAAIAEAADNFAEWFGIPESSWLPEW